MLEAAVVTTILALVFVGLVRMGAAALHRLATQNELSSAAWSRAAGAPPPGTGHKVRRASLGWRAGDAATRARSLEVDLADDR